ncbi:MAG: hypothetical protein AVDCRST_MAG31-2132, partial [uncultured Sphingomonas sp.]
ESGLSAAASTDQRAEQRAGLRPSSSKIRSPALRPDCERRWFDPGANL